MKNSIKKIFKYLIFILLISNLYSFEIVTKSKISEVVVYPDSALITRVASVELKTGDYQVIFPDIIPEIDENSLRVSASGDAKVKLFSVELKKEYLEEVPSEKIKQLKNEIQKLEDEIVRQQNLKTILSEEKNFLNSIILFSKEQIPKDLVTKMPTTKDLDEILKFLDVKLKENYSQVMDCELKIRELTNKVDVLKRELSEISTPQKKLKRSILVNLEVLKPGNLNLNVSYLVRGASWQPLYDARANFEKSEVELVSYGVVRQTTGEDWEDVEITLSTAKTAIPGRMPEVSSWFLRPYQPPIIKEERPVPMLVSGAGAPLQIKHAVVEYKGTAVVYKIPRKATIKSDGSEHKLPISSQILNAKFEYSAYPRASNYAYLRSRVTNAKDLQLLAGRVNIFLEGDFVGTSTIDNVAPSEEFDLYLGIDENVKVKKECLEKKVDDVLIGGISSPTRKTTFKYKITIENYKNKKIKMNLFESMPVSENERIKVKISNVSLQPTEKDSADKKGVWLWVLELEPKQKQQIFYTFSVEHPRDMQVEGL